MVSVKEKSRHWTVAGVYQEDERKRTIDEVSKIIRVVSKPGFLIGSGISAEATCLLSARHPA